MQTRSVFPILFALWLTVFAASSQVIIVAPILPDIGRALGVPEAHLGWLITSYAAMLGLFALGAGPVSDRIGRRRILLLGSTAMAGVLFLHGIATSFVSLLAMRALAGAAGGLLSGAAVAYVGDYFPYERRGWANGWVMSGIAVGQVLGIPAGKILAVQLGYAWPFIAYGFVMAVAALIILRFVPQPDVVRASRRVTPRVMAQQYALLVRDPAAVASMGAYFLMFVGIGLFVPYFPTWLENFVGLSGTEVAMLFLFGGLTNMAAGPVAGRISDRIGRKPLVVASCLLFSVVMLATTYTVHGLFSAIVLFSVAMLSVAMRLAPLQSLLSALVPDNQRGTMMSAAISSGQIGMSVAAGFAGMLYARLGFIGNTVGGAVVIVAMAFVVHRFIPEPKQETGVDGAELVEAA